MRAQLTGPASYELAVRLKHLPLLKAFEDRHLKSILSASRPLVFDPDETPKQPKEKPARLERSIEESPPA
ncbi:MAG: hypothetical protein IPM75_16295 [Candidatus Competibacteraceae bacterium]|nr:hypothetical protein [Candidatus Competibacteraceae bacterium]MBK8964549.1 hypothetical protein [Candidatus Competibacteraceae bacterium]